MTIKVNIIKTEIGWEYRENDTQRIIATIKESRNKPNVYIWRSPYANNDGCNFTSAKQAHYEVQHNLNAVAYAIGVDIEFNEI